MRRNEEIADGFVVYVMLAHPKSLHALRHKAAKGSIVKADLNVVEATSIDRFEQKRRIRSINLELSIITAS